MKRIVPFLLSLVLLVTSGLTPALAEMTKCTAITTVPITITVPGAYCLTRSFFTPITTGSAITINSNWVVLDLNGFILYGTAGKGTNAYGIKVEKKQNVTVRNGIVRGFYVGVYFDDNSPYITSRANVIEEIRADQNTYVGIHTKGMGNVIRNNIVSGTGGTTVTTGDGATTGIGAQGTSARVLGNEVMDVASTGAYAGVGIVLMDGRNCIVADNRVSNITAASGQYAVGIALSSNLSNVVVTDNRLSGMKDGIYFGGTPVATGTYMNNLVRNATIRYTGGTAAGATNY